MYNINKISILLVEDDADLTQYWAGHLASRFAHVYRAGHAFEALETLHRHAPDIVMVDVGLPEMDGYTLCQEIRDHPDFSHIPVILYKSGYLSAEDQRHGLRSGAVRVMNKPGSIDEIVEVVQAAYTEQRVKMVVDSEPDSAPATEPKDGGYADFLTRQLGETINQLKKEQTALSRALNRYKDFAYQRSDFFWETDANGLLTFLDAGARNRLGLPENHYRGVTFIDFFGRFLSADGLDQFTQVFSRLGVLDVSCKLRDRNNFRIVRLQGKPYYHADHGFAGYRGSLTDITDTKLTSEKLYFAAHHDAMTGLLNAQAFKSLLESELQMLQQNERHVLCYLDLDFFKEVNDRAGHRAGDQLLVQLADLFRRKVRSNDVVARIGGDEFAILLRNCNLDQARRLIQELHNSIKTFRFYWEGQRFEIGLSIGLLQIENSKLSVSEVMDLADQACYAAKHGGRNQIRVFGDDQTSGKLTGFTYGINLGYSNDRFRIDAAVKRDDLVLEYTAPTLDPFGNGEATTSVVTTGANLEMGYVVYTSGAMTLEAVAAAQYSRTEVGDWALQGTGITQGGTSLLGGIGFNVTGNRTIGAGFTPSVSVMLWNEFEGQNTPTVSSGGTTVTSVHDTGGLSGEISAKLDFGGESGWNGYVGGSARFGAGQTSLAANLGFGVTF